MVNDVLLNGRNHQWLHSWAAQEAQLQLGRKPVGILRCLHLLTSGLAAFG